MVLENINLGSGNGVTIKELLETLKKFIDFDYEFDLTKPQVRGFMDISLAKEKISFFPETTLLDGLKETWLWYLKNKEEFKKRKNYFK